MCSAKASGEDVVVTGSNGVRNSKDVTVHKLCTMYISVRTQAAHWFRLIIVLALPPREHFISVFG